MTRDDIIQLYEKANGWSPAAWPNTVEDLARFAALVAQRERDELVVMFLEAHEGAKTAHNYWAVAANKIKERSA